MTIGLAAAPLVLGNINLHGHSIFQSLTLDLGIATDYFLIDSKVKAQSDLQAGISFWFSDNVGVSVNMVKPFKIFNRKYLKKGIMTRDFAVFHF